MKGAGTKAIRKNIIARGKRVRAASQARREKRWTMPIFRDLDHHRLVYGDGSPVDPSDPRVSVTRDGLLIETLTHRSIVRDTMRMRFPTS